ncbi:MAG TPA: hypothetical protein VGJ94_19100 [Syntrophorhabdaceae bacterium]|jgi:hypothetical protein
MNDGRGMAGLLLVLLGIAAMFCYRIFQADIIALLENCCSQDHHILPVTMRRVNIAAWFMMAMTLASGLVLIKARDEYWWSRVKSIFVRDPLPGPGLLSPVPVLCLSSVIGFAFTVGYALFSKDGHNIAYREDGILETLTAVLMLLNAIVLGISVIKMKAGNEQATKGPRYVLACYWLLVLVFFLDAMEELSWGQRIFGWNTPALLTDSGFREINIHNFMDLDYYLYFCPILLPVATMAQVYLELKKNYLSFARLVLPHSNMIGLNLAICFAGVIGWPELLEELVSLLASFYVFRIFLFAKYNTAKEMAHDPAEMGPNLYSDQKAVMSAQRQE